jgi:hypothetical protein
MCMTKRRSPRARSRLALSPVSSKLLRQDDRGARGIVDAGDAFGAGFRGSDPAVVRIIRIDVDDAHRVGPEHDTLGQMVEVREVDLRGNHAQGARIRPRRAGTGGVRGS